MRIFFDSSVLIPVFYADHPRHDPSARCFRAATKENSFCALRTLGEVYATLTGLPIRPRITGPEGLVILDQIRARLTLVSLSEDAYLLAIRRVAASIVGAATYDAIIAQCALESRADVLLTWNVKDFTRMGPDVAALVKTPLDV